MSKDIQFVTDADGNRTGAVIPIEEYEEWLALREGVGKEDGPNSQRPVGPVIERELLVILQNALSSGLELPRDPQAGVETEAN